ncbi:MAG: acyl-CoA thioesterase [Pseudomonadales bacterium]|nr:acyl-CoA thioesterase [Pseudomonadales bacterium]NNL10831.1 acyl-CoA thioesterase [Pseudomonadales bacterium]
MSELDTEPRPSGELILQVLAHQNNTNALGDIYGGWLLQQMDMASGVTARKLAQGRLAAVSVGGVNFMVPVQVGALVSFYTEVRATGRSSIEVFVEVWTDTPDFQGPRKKVTEGMFTYVAIDENGRTRTITQ